MSTTLRGPLLGRITPYIQSLVLLCLLVSAASSEPVWAQSRVLEEIIVEQSTIIERFSPPPVKGSADLNVPPLEERIPPELAAQRTLTPRNVRIERATLFPENAFAPLWADLVGRKIPVTALYELTDRIERLYRDAGILALAVVPVQDLSTGDVRIVVFDQSYIQTVETTGDYPNIRQRLAPYIDKLIAMQPLRIKRIERVLLLMSDLAGMNIEATLRRPDTPGNGGSLTLEINFEKRVLRFSLDNRGTEEVGPFQAFATHQENDLLGFFESTTVTGVTVPDSPRELLLGQLAQDVPVGSDGWHAGYQVGLTKSHPGGDLDALDLDVSSVTGRIYASYPVLRTIDHSLVIGVSLNTRNTDVDLGARAQSRDRYRWLAFGVDAEHSVVLGPLNVRAEYLQGIDAFNATDEGSALGSRQIAEVDFQVAAGGADLLVELSDRITLLARASGQFAFGPLPSMAQMSFGGDPFGRAFDFAAASGDSGVAGSLELSRDTDLPLGVVRNATAYAFIDYGLLWFRGNDREHDRANLGSTGIGFRASLDQGLAIDNTLAIPIEYDPGVEDTGGQVFFSLKKRF